MLPRTCNPDLLASRAERLRGALPVDGLRRFLRAVERAADPVRVDLRFQRDESGLTRIGGRLEVPIRLTCQRCLEPFDFRLDATLDLLVVRSEGEAERRGREREVVRLDGDSLPLLDVIEDELMLALPMHAFHPPGRCSAPVLPLPASVESGTRTRGPFAGLEELIHSHPT